MGEGNGLLKTLGGLFAFLTVLLLGFLVIQEKYEFINNDSLIATLEKVQKYMVIGSLAIIGFVFASKRGFIIFILYMAAVVAIVVFTFLPGMWLS